MALSSVLFLYMVAFLAGVYSRPAVPAFLAAAYGIAAIALAAGGMRLPARSAAACAFFVLGGMAGLAGSAPGPVEARPGLSILSGRAGVVTENGLFLEGGEWRAWVGSRRCAACCMEGDSLLVLGFVDSGYVRCAGFSVVPATDPLTVTRRFLAREWADAISSPGAAALVSALLVGERSRVPDDVRLAFRGSGASHILSVSGFHVSLVAAMVFLALRSVAGKKPWVLVPAVALLSGYVLLTGAKAPAVRSGFSAALVLCCAAAGIRTDPLVLWSLAAAVVLAACPGAAGDAGAQMSFAAVLALVLFSRRFGGRLGWAASTLHSGACVTLALAPLVAGTYGYFQLSSPYTTLFSVPFMVGLMVLGLAGLAHLPVDRPAGALASAWVSILAGTSLPGARFPAWAWPFWSFALLMLLLDSKRRGFPRRFR